MSDELGRLFSLAELLDRDWLACAGESVPVDKVALASVLLDLGSRRRAQCSRA